MELDCDFVRERIIQGDIKLQPIQPNLELADIFTKSLPLHSFFEFCYPRWVWSICYSFHLKGGVLECILEFPVFFLGIYIYLYIDGKGYSTQQFKSITENPQQ